MAARIRLQHQDEVRARIQASQLVNRLTNHALGKLKKKGMDASQVTAALGLLKKCLPDLNSVEHSGPNGGEIDIKFKSDRDFGRHVAFALAKAMRSKEAS